MKVRDIMTARQFEGDFPPRQSPLAAVPPCLAKERTIYQELADALAVFPDWQALLIKSTVLDMSVWVVRNPIDGIAIARETGQPALLLDDVLQQKGRTPEEARAALLSVLILGTVQ